MSDFSTPEKKFCCLKMKEVLQANVYEETKNMTDKEILAYFNREPDFEPFRKLWRKKHNINK